LAEVVEAAQAVRTLRTRKIRIAFHFRAEVAAVVLGTSPGRAVVVTTPANPEALHPAALVVVAVGRPHKLARLVVALAKLVEVLVITGTLPRAVPVPLGPQ
jgi:hypothetical protein